MSTSSLGRGSVTGKKWIEFDRNVIMYNKLLILRIVAIFKNKDLWTTWSTTSTSTLIADQAYMYLG